MSSNNTNTTHNTNGVRQPYAPKPRTPPPTANLGECATCRGPRKLDANNIVRCKCPSAASGRR